MGSSRLTTVVLGLAIVVVGLVLLSSPFELSADLPSGSGAGVAATCRSPLAEHLLDRWSDGAASSSLAGATSEACADAARQRLAAGLALIAFGLVLRPLTRVRATPDAAAVDRRGR